MSEVRDAFGNYARVQSWFVAGDPRFRVYEWYADSLSPEGCRELWDALGAEVPESERAGERDERYCAECADRIIRLQDLVDRRYQEINNSFGGA
jgi:hypothetical protein